MIRRPPSFALSPHPEVPGRAGPRRGGEEVGLRVSEGSGEGVSGARARCHQHAAERNISVEAQYAKANMPERRIPLGIPQPVLNPFVQRAVNLDDQRRSYLMQSRRPKGH